jgi:hypothetical protein
LDIWCHGLPELRSRTLELITKYSAYPIVSLNLVQSSQLFYGIGTDSSLQLVNVAEYLPRIRRSLETILFNPGARVLYHGDLNHSRGKVERPAISFGDCDVLPFSFILSGLPWGRSPWIPVACLFEYGL